MSNFHIGDHNIEDSEILSRLDDHLDDSWSLCQETLRSQLFSPVDDQFNINEIEYYNRINDASKNAAIQVEQHELSTRQGDQDIVDNGLKSMKIDNSTPKSKNVTRNKDSKISKKKSAMELQSPEEGPSSSKKLDHNAKERIRRMKINASYLALRALLPDSRRLKKRSSSAPAIVDKVLKYIPELENELEALRSKKENVQSTAAKNKKIIDNRNCQFNDQSRTISFNKVNENEAIIQICMGRVEGKNGLAFSNLLQCVENEGICVKSASTVYVCESRISYHLHIQIKHATPGADFIEELRDKVISWLR